MKMMGICSIIIVARDRFSVTAGSIDSVIQNTPAPIEIIVVLGGIPARMRQKLIAQYAGAVQFIFTPHFLNPAQARNLGLKKAQSRLAVLMDNDVFVKPGWLAPLLECQSETGAAMVVPVILESETKIHTAGNNFYVTYENGRQMAHKTLRYHGVIYSGASNMKRQRTDYGELHCQLVDVKTALDLNVYDENIQEVGECDSGLVWKNAGCEMWFEPASVVRYEFPTGIYDVNDLKFFIWRWDMRLILKGYEYFFKKWNIDMTEHGDFRNFLLTINSKVGFLPRVMPTAWALFIENQIIRPFAKVLSKIFVAPVAAWRRFRAWHLGYYDWPGSNSTLQIHAPILSGKKNEEGVVSNV